MILGYHRNHSLAGVIDITTMPRVPWKDLLLYSPKTDRENLHTFSDLSDLNLDYDLDHFSQIHPFLKINIFFFFLLYNIVYYYCVLLSYISVSFYFTILFIVK